MSCRLTIIVSSLIGPLAWAANLLAPNVSDEAPDYNQPDSDFYKLFAQERNFEQLKQYLERLRVVYAVDGDPLSLARLNRVNHLLEANNISHSRCDTRTLMDTNLLVESSLHRYPASVVNYLVYHRHQLFDLCQQEIASSFRGIIHALVAQSQGSFIEKLNDFGERINGLRAVSYPGRREREQALLSLFNVNGLRLYDLDEIAFTSACKEFVNYLCYFVTLEPIDKILDTIDDLNHDKGLLWKELDGLDLNILSGAGVCRNILRDIDGVVLGVLNLMKKEREL